MSTVWILHCQHCHPGLGSSLTVFQCLRNVFLYSQNPQTSTCRSIIIQLWAWLKQEGERTCCPKVSACFAWLKPPHKAPGAVPEQGRGQPVAPAAPQILPIVTSSCPLHPAVPGRLWVPVLLRVLALRARIGLQPRSWGYKPEQHFLPPAHCARAGSCAAPAAPALSSHPEVTWARSILAAPGGAEPSPGSSGWKGAESSQALALLSVEAGEPPRKADPNAIHKMRL